MAVSRDQFVTLKEDYLK